MQWESPASYENEKNGWVHMGEDNYVSDTDISSSQQDTKNWIVEDWQQS